MIPGTRLGRYEVVAPLGKGGMGEVWTARDSTLHRLVALKALPAAVTHDTEALARLQREAALLASLNHPNIATIHGLEEHDGVCFLVLELIEGDTLADRLDRGPLNADEALGIGRQIAEALEAAHSKGIVHRDLKPANIKITPEGRVKVLDFGLAKTLDAVMDDGETRPETRAGMVMGTPAYMSPEQARGEMSTPQTDIWAFGVVMFELLSGLSPFRRRSTAETLAEVLSTQPDFSKLPGDVPRDAVRVIRRCLEKDLRRRQQHIGDVRLAFEDAFTAPESTATTGRASSVRERAPMAGTAVVLAVLTGIGGWWWRGPGVPRAETRVMHLAMPFQERPLTQPFGTQRVVLSRDGSQLAFVGLARLFVRSLDRREPLAVASLAQDPFFSPDGRWIGYFGDSSLMKVSVKGGTPTPLAVVSGRPLGASWRADGTIFFASNEGVFSVPENGGTPRVVATPARDKKEVLYGWPEALPGTRALLFTVIAEGASDGAIVWLDLGTGERKSVTEGSAARYLTRGSLVYASARGLKVVGFDASAGQVIGEAVTSTDVEIGRSADNGAADFSVSDTGTLAYLPPSGNQGRMLQWINRVGQAEPLALEPARFGYVAVSPDGKRVALDQTRGGGRDVWVLDLARLSLTQLTNGPTEDILPKWSTDGSRVFFGSNRTGTFDIYSQRADGADAARVEFAGPGQQLPQHPLPDGGGVLVNDEFKDIALLKFSQPQKLEPLLHSSANERLAQVSPDGRWIVYESNESGTNFEVFLRPFPAVSDRREKVSIDGGRFPLWGPKGNELYYVTPDGDMMAVPITTAPSLVIGKPTRLFSIDKPSPGQGGRPFDVSPADGRFLVVSAREPSQEPGMASVVLNWLNARP